MKKITAPFLLFVILPLYGGRKPKAHRVFSADQTYRYLAEKQRRKTIADYEAQTQPNLSLHSAEKHSVIPERLNRRMTQEEIKDILLGFSAVFMLIGGKQMFKNIQSGRDLLSISNLTVCSFF